MDSAPDHSMCNMPFRSIYVLADGTVYPCCFSPNRLTPLADLNREDALRIWERGYAKLREQTLAGDPPEACRDCILGYINRVERPPARMVAAPVRATLPEGSVFSTPEREWLRLAAMLNPPWPAMVQIARTALDYGALRRLAPLHQLDGVVAWRLCDERMDGVAPNIVREDCQRYLDHLDGANASWWVQVGQFCDALENRRIEYVVHGGPVQYAPLSIEHFPRSWDAIDIEVRVDSEDEIDAIAEATGSRRHRWFPAWSTLTMPGGLEIGLGCELDPLTNDVGRSAYTIWDEPPLFVEILGRQMPIPSLPVHVLRMAGYHTWNNVVSEARRLPLWALARLAAWTQHEAWSWDAFSELLKQVNEAHGDLAPRNAWADRDLHRRDSHAWRALWLLGIADRVYGLLGGRSLASLVSPLDVVEPVPITIGERFDQPGKQFSTRACQWHWPGDEAMLFDYQLVEGYNERIQAGIWSDAGREPMKHYLAADGARRYELEEVRDA